MIAELESSRARGLLSQSVSQTPTLLSLSWPQPQISRSSPIAQGWYKFKSKLCPLVSLFFRLRLILIPLLLCNLLSLSWPQAQTSRSAPIAQTSSSVYISCQQSTNLSLKNSWVRKILIAELQSCRAGCLLSQSISQTPQLDTKIDAGTNLSRKNSRVHRPRQRLVQI